MLRFICAVLLLAVAARSSSGQTYVRVALDEPGVAGQATHLIGGEKYTFNASEVPAGVLRLDDPLRTVTFGSQVRLGYSAAQHGAKYEARLTFVSELPRTLVVSAGSATLADHLEVDPGKVVHVQYPVEPDADGTIDLRLRCLAGPNAAVSEVEILSTDPRPLAAIKDPQAAAERRMKDVIASLPTEPERLSPRPITVVGVAEPLVSLNDRWTFSATLPADVTSDAAAWKPIDVPGEWAMQGFTVAHGAMACYARAFDVPADWNGRRVKLRFDSVNSDCQVWVNGRAVGRHEGGFVPFECDMTDAVHVGVNQLRVGVQSETTSDTLGSVSQYAAHTVGGILRKVQLFALPDVNLAGQVVTTPLSDGGNGATLTVDTRVAAESGTPDGVAVALRLLSPEGREVPLTGATWNVARELRHTFACPVSRPQLWDAEHPRLYRLQTTLTRGTTVLETVEQRVGFRQVEVRGNQLLVNFRPVKLLGVCRHEVSPLTGRSLSPALCRRDAELFRAANCNYIRTSHYPPSEEFLDAADELGLFVESESALCWIQHNANTYWKQHDYLDPGILPYMVRANLEKMAAGRDHPSVILWSLANESYWSPLWAEVQRRVQALDPSRPDTFHDQCWGGYNNNHSQAPIGVYHYPGTNGPGKCDAEPRPILFGEYSHIECYNRRELVTDPGIRDDWGRPQERMVDLMQSHPGCLGGAIWSGIDDVFHMPDGRIVGYGPWGIIDGWRREKPEYWQVRKTYSPIRVVDRNKPLEAGATVLRIPVENRYSFTDLAEVKIDWSIGKQSGTATAKVPPRSTGTIVVKLPEPTGAGQALDLTFTDPRGFCCESESLKVAAAAAPPATAPSAPATVSESAEVVTIQSGRSVFRIDRRTGEVTGSAGGRPSLAAIGLMLLPLNDDSGGDGGQAGNDYQNHIEPFTPSCTGWRLKGVTVDQTDGEPTVHIAGSYHEAEGAYTLQFSGDGDVAVSYAFTATKAVKPRQWGVVLTAPATCDTLHWERDAQWTVYPADHIGRPVGIARANAQHRDAVEQPRLPMTGPWSSDTMDMGSNDFRSTKYHVRRVSLTDGAGGGLEVKSDGTDSARAWVDGPNVHLLVAGFHTGGADGYYAAAFGPERRPIAAGKTFKGAFVLSLLSP
jgi:beta-galactosidase